jgi:hypothetical protein
MGRDTVVVIATSYGLDGTGIVSHWGRKADPAFHKLVLGRSRG